MGEKIMRSLIYPLGVKNYQGCREAGILRYIKSGRFETKAVYSLCRAGPTYEALVCIRKHWVG